MKLNFFNFSVKLSDEFDGVLELQRFGGHIGTDGRSCSIADLFRFLLAVTTLGSG